MSVRHAAISLLAILLSGLKLNMRLKLQRAVLNYSGHALVSCDVVVKNVFS